MTFLNHWNTLLYVSCPMIAHPHLLVWATSERFPLTRAVFRSALASESHWLQPLLVFTVHWWPDTSLCGRAMNEEKLLTSTVRGRQGRHFVLNN